MDQVAKGPRGERRGRGARERILGAAQRLFREQGIAGTGMDQLCAEAQVSKRTAYQHFGSKDQLVAEHLRRLEQDVIDEVLARTDLTPRERLLAVVEASSDGAGRPTPLCPFIAAAVEIADPDHPARARAREYKRSVAARLAATAREAGAVDPELLGEQLALVLDGVSARTRVLDSDAVDTAVAVARTLVDQAVPATAAAAGGPPVPRAGDRQVPTPR